MSTYIPNTVYSYIFSSSIAACCNFPRLLSKALKKVHPDFCDKSRQTLERQPLIHYAESYNFYPGHEDNNSRNIIYDPSALDHIPLRCPLSQLFVYYVHPFFLRNILGVVCNTVLCHITKSPSAVLAPRTGHLLEDLKPTIVVLNTFVLS